MRKYFLLLCFFLPIIIAAQVIQIADWHFRKLGDVKWLPASVPGCVHTDLFKNKLIPDPFFGDNEKKIQWIENEDWEYETNFTFFKENFDFDHIEMVFEGLDTYAKVYLNDSLILYADNMFRSWNVDVKKYLKAGKNHVYILFESATKIENLDVKKLGYTLPDNKRVFTRKAAFQYGWDFAPRFVTCGIWKNIKINKYDIAKIENCNVKQYFQKDSSVILQFECKIKSDVSANFLLELSSPNIPSPSTPIHLNIKSIIGDSVYSFSYRIKNPKLWWCNRMGNQYLYGFRLMLHYEQKFIYAYDLRIGIRTLELVKEKDKIGESFYFKLNGIPVFMKGANCVPPDIFTYRSYYNSKCQEIILNAKNANMNMLRMWGGGIYPDDKFYDLCDENGILVWQDFMFAGAMYPGDDAFKKNVSEEIKEQVIRLRNHPSLALWCGNNEIDEAWKNWGWRKQFHISKLDSGIIWNDYVELFQVNIPNIIHEFDSARTNLFISSSPEFGWGRNESLTSGDCHYWGIWWGNEPFENYNLKVGRFMSEYGFQSLPSFNSIQKFVDSSEINFGSEQFLNHQKHKSGNQIIQQFLFDEYFPTTDFKKYIYQTQLQQAIGMKTAIEAHRRNKPYCMGTLFWQLNDCWPSVSWSAIDYYNNKKANYFEAKRDFKINLLSIYHQKGTYEVHLITDSINDFVGKLEFKILDIKGSVLFSDSSNEFNVHANSSQVVYLFPDNFIDTMNVKNIFASFIFKSIDGTEICATDYIFVKQKEFEFLKPIFTISKINDKMFSVKSNVYAKNLEIQFTNSSIQLSDNFINLLPNKPVTIQILSDEKFSDIENKLSFMSSFDLMK